MLDCGPTKLWELINAHQIESFLDGSRRIIVVASIQRYIERLRNVGGAADGLPKKAVKPQFKARKQ